MSVGVWVRRHERRASCVREQTHFRDPNSSSVCVRCRSRASVVFLNVVEIINKISSKTQPSLGSVLI